MRQVGDTLAWLAMIVVFAAVIYFTPRVAHYVGAMEPEHARGCATCGDASHEQGEASDRTP